LRVRQSARSLLAAAVQNANRGNGLTRGFKGLPVRTFRWLIIALFLLPWLAGNAIAPSDAAEDMSGGWRRTSQGWQRVELVCPPMQYRRPALHPALVGSLEVLLTMTAMLSLSNRRRLRYTARGGN
jgi:hypothetical protein